MEKIRLGRTGLLVSRSGFGAIPIQRIPRDQSTALLRRAVDGGINFFDTAHGYSDSEEKIGEALSGLRSQVVIATKTPAADAKTLFEQLELSLRRLRTDYIDLYQLHNPKKMPAPGDGSGLYEALLEAKRKGMIRFIGITNHRRPVAAEAVDSKLYDTLQFPLSSLSSDEDVGLMRAAQAADVGFIAMKGMAGGLLTNARSTFAFLRSLNYAVPIWGIERPEELEEFIELERNPPALDAEILKTIEKDRAELSGSFCRGCGYCMPCPAGIEINVSARLMFLIKRSRFEQYLTPEWQEKMARIDLCISCGQCAARCPYELDPPALLKKQLSGYRAFLASR